MQAEQQKRGVFQKSGYRELAVWKNAYELRKLIFNLTLDFPKSEYRRIAQMRDAARSTKQNIQEGYRRKSTKEYLRFLDISYASLHELAGDVEDSFDDNLIGNEQFEELVSLINRTDFLFDRLIASLQMKRVGRTTLPSPSHPPLPS